MPEGLLLIKNMVCYRCIAAVENILTKLLIPFEAIQLGEVTLASLLSAEQKKALENQLNQIGFELLDTRISSAIERVKQLIIKRARNEVPEDEARHKLSSFPSQHLHHEYSYLSHLFSSIEGRTIENYFIEQRIEYVKELLVYEEQTLSEIALQLEYSSTAHLSAQFKKVTGLTPTHYKKIGAAKRKALDKV